MRCSKCGMENEGGRFCINCGEVLGEAPVAKEQPLESNTNETQNGYGQNVQSEVKQESHNTNENHTSIGAENKNTGFNIFKYIINAAIRPFESFKNNENHLSKIKTSGIFTLIVAAIMMVANLIVKMINVVAVPKYDWSSYSVKRTIDFSNLKSLDYVSLIFKNYFIYLIIIVAIAAVYYVGSLIVKKNLNFSKLLGASSTAIIPFIVLNIFLAPILALIWDQLYIVFMIVGIVYYIVVLIVLLNRDLKFENKDHSIYFNSACAAVLLIAGYYIAVNLILNQFASSVSTLGF